MANDAGEFYNSPDKSGDKASPPREGHGCFFYGCIFAIVLAVLMAVGIGVVGYFTYRYVTQLIEQNTSPTPTDLPKVKLAEDERKSLDARVEAFKTALDKNEDAEPLVLTGDELNAVLAEHAKTEGKVYFKVDGDKLSGEVSLPLDQVPLPGTKGRFLNAKATFRIALEDGRLMMFVDSAEVKGKPLPAEFMTGLRNQNLAQDAARDPDNAKFLNKLESIQIKDGKIVIKATSKAARGSATPKEADKPEAPPSGLPAPKESEKPSPAETEKAKAAPTENVPTKDAPAKADPAKEIEKSAGAEHPRRISPIGSRDEDILVSWSDWTASTSH